MFDLPALVSDISSAMRTFGCIHGSATVGYTLMQQGLPPFFVCTGDALSPHLPDVTTPCLLVMQAPEVFKLVLGATLGLFVTPVMAFAALLAKGRQASSILAN